MRNRYRAELLDSTTYSHEIALSPRCRLPPMSWLSAYLEPLCTLSSTYIYSPVGMIPSYNFVVANTLDVSESWNWIILFHEILIIVLMIFLNKSILNIEFLFVSWFLSRWSDEYFKLFKRWWSFIFILDLGKIIRNYYKILITLLLYFSVSKI